MTTKYNGVISIYDILGPFYHDVNVNFSTLISDQGRIINILRFFFYLN